MTKPKLLLSLESVINSINNIINGTTKVGNADKLDNKDSSEFASASHTHSGYAPTSHAADGSTYGLGTNALYGHVALSDSLTSTSGQTSGVAATPAAIKAAHDKIIKDYTTVVITASQSWTVPANVYSVDVFLMGGGAGGTGGGAAKGQYTSHSGGSGGSSALYGTIMGFKVTPGESIPIVIGGGGAGGNGGVVSATTGSQYGITGSAGGGSSFKNIGIYTGSANGTGGNGSVGVASNGILTSIITNSMSSPNNLINNISYGGGGGGGGGGQNDNGNLTTGTGGGGAGTGGNGANGSTSSASTGTGITGTNGTLGGGGGGGGGIVTYGGTGTVTGGKGGNGGNGVCVIRYKEGV